jgi:hypothetical protein
MVVETSHFKVCKFCGNRIYNNADDLHECSYDEEDE